MSGKVARRRAFGREVEAESLMSRLDGGSIELTGRLKCSACEVRWEQL